MKGIDLNYRVLKPLGELTISKILKDMLHKKFSLADNNDTKKEHMRILSITFCAATDGNHGKSVAWGASQFGCKSKIYLHSGVSQTRESEIAKYGADIIRVKGSYDDSVKQCAWMEKIMEPRCRYKRGGRKRGCAKVSNASIIF